MEFSQHTKRRLLLALALAAVTIAIYWPVHQYGFVRYDDPIYIQDNPHVTSGLSFENVIWAFTTGHASNWHPLTWISHMVDFHLFGVSPGAMHAVNVCLHALNTVLLFLLLASFSQRKGRDEIIREACNPTDSFWRALVVAALFAVHPLHVESVAWISERKDVLSTLFLLLTLWAYSISVQLDKSPRQLRYRWLALFLFALGLMSKPMLVTTPFLLLLLDVWPLDRVRLPWRPSQAETPRVSLMRAVGEKLPFFGLSLASSIITYIAQSRGHAVTIVLPLTSRASNAVASYLKYIWMTFWPSDLSVFYPHPDTRFPISEQWPLWAIALSAAVLVAISVLAVWRLARQPWFFTGWFWFVGTLVPVIGIVQVGGQALADRYTYVPHIGLFICIVWWAGEWVPRFRLPFSVVAVSCVVLVGALAVVSRGQVSYWRNTLTLFEHALAVTRNNAVAHCHVGIVYGETGQPEKAIEHFQAAIAAAPATAEAYFGLGYTYELQGKLDQAVQQYRAALALRPWDDWVQNRMGVALSGLGRRDEAIACFEKAIQLRPDFAEAHENLGLALAESNDLRMAQLHLEKAAKLKPGDRQTLKRLADVLVRKGEPGAVLVFRELIRVDPSNPENYINLGGVLWRLGKRDEALEQYQAACKAAPNSALAAYTLGTAFQGRGMFREAAEAFGRASSLQPNYVEAIANEARSLAALGEYDKAVQGFRQAVRLRQDPSIYLNLGLSLAALHRVAEAIEVYEQALSLKSDWPPALAELAWTLSTASDSSLRDGPRALTLAARAVELTGEKDPNALAALDTSYAENGQWEQASATAERVRKAAESIGQTQMAAAAQERIKLYQMHQPYREK